VAVGYRDKRWLRNLLLAVLAVFSIFNLVVLVELFHCISSAATVLNPDDDLRPILECFARTSRFALIAAAMCGVALGLCAVCIYDLVKRRLATKP
jgi:hypothetical protein